MPLALVAPGFYAVPPSGAQVCWVYFLYKDGSLTGALTLADSWTTYGGLYLFCAAPVDPAGAPGFLDEARGRLFPARIPQAWHALVWLPGANDLGAAQTLAFTGTGPVVITTPAVLYLGDLGVSFAANFSPAIALTPDAPQGPGFTLSAADPQAVRLTYGAVTPAIHTIGSPDYWTLELPVSGPLAGSLVFDVGLDTGQLQSAFGMGFVYGYGSASSAQGLFYPMAQPQLPGRSPQQFPDFTLMANPALPFVAAATRFAWLGNTPLPTFAYQVATVAASASPELRPPETVFAVPAPASQAGPWVAGGWGLHQAPGGMLFPGETGRPSPCPLTRTYLAPVGLWTLSSTPAPPPGGPTVSLDLMPGLAISEYLTIGDGETVHFACGQPAHASDYPSSGPASPGQVETAALIGTFTAPWLEMVEQKVATPGRGYYSQPIASPFFAPVPGEDTLLSVKVRVGRLQGPEPLPFVPYGGIGAALPDGSAACNPGVAAAVFLGFESQVLSTVRHAALATAPDGPALLPLMVSPPVQPVQAATPVGLLIDLTPEGTWRKLTLARSPQAADASPLGLAELSVAGAGSGTPPFPADLAFALTQNELTLIISQPGADWAFANRILVDGFEFRLDLAADGAVLVFKFNTTANLADLVGQPSLWAQASMFNDDPEQISAVLDAAIAEAQADVARFADSPFRGFVELAADPTWTGIVAFGAAIDGSNMPADLQMLLGGITGTLRAHHFGIQANQLTPDGASGIGLSMDQSSLFGVIHYKDPGTAPASPEPDLDYRLELLNVSISNSQVTRFDATVGLALNALFGRPLALLSPVPSPPLASNTLVINGRYQTRNGVGQVTFRTAQPYLYAFQPPAPGCSQVLAQIHFDGASLAPVGNGETGNGETGSGAGGSGTQQVKACFLLNGELWFSPDPFPVADPIDLFSYGVAASGGTGLPFTGLGIDLSFDLDGSGSTVPGSQTLVFAPSSLVAAPTAAAIRENSLLAALPLRFTRFIVAPPEQPLTAARAGAQPVQVLQLEALSGDAQTGSPPPASPPMPAPASSAQSPYGTASPNYALEYDITLGSLGKLSDLGVSLTAKLLLAWGPSPTTPDNDAAAVLIQLPQLNAGAAGFSLEGILKTTFGDANLLKVPLDDGSLTYAMMFGNVQLSVFGYTFPPGVLIDFLLFAGAPQGGAPTNSNNLAWFVSAQQS